MTFLPRQLCKRRSNLTSSRCCNSRHILTANYKILPKDNAATKKYRELGFSDLRITLLCVLSGLKYLYLSVMVTWLQTFPIVHLAHPGAVQLTCPENADGGSPVKTLPYGTL